MPGRRPKSSYEKAILGNPGRRPLNHDEPNPQVGVPRKPPHLGKFASELWDELVETLTTTRVLTMADGRALEMACMAYDEYRTASAETGPKRKNNVISDAWKRYRSMLIEFGLTPSSRPKVRAIPLPDDEKKLFKF